MGGGREEPAETYADPTRVTLINIVTVIYLSKTTTRKWACWHYCYYYFSFCPNTFHLLKRRMTTIYLLKRSGWSRLPPPRAPPNSRPGWRTAATREILKLQDIYRLIYLSRPYYFFFCKTDCSYYYVWSCTPIVCACVLPKISLGPPKPLCENRSTGKRKKGQNRMRARLNRTSFGRLCTQHVSPPVDSGTTMRIGPVIGNVTMSVVNNTNSTIELPSRVKIYLSRPVTTGRYLSTVRI